MTRGEKIKMIRERLGLSQTALADKINVSKQTMYKYENNIVTNIPTDKIEAIALACRCTPEYLMGWEDEDHSTNLSQYGLRPVRRHKVPLLGPIACGTPIYAEEQYDAYVDSDVDADFCLTAKGDSMVNAKIYDGDIVFIKEMSMVDDGDIAAVIIDDEATLKRVYFDKKKEVLTLIAENPKYAPMVYSAEDAKSVRILGKALMVEHWL